MMADQYNDDEYLVRAQFTGPTLPKLFDAVRSCKGPGVICFTPHDITVVGAEYRGNDEDPDNLVLGMCFTLTHHEADEYHVAEAKVQRSAPISQFHTLLNVKAFRNTAKDYTRLTMLITKAEPEKLTIIQQKENGGGDVQHTLNLRETNTNPFEYDHAYHPSSSRIVSSIGLRDKCNALVTYNHKYCTLRITADEILFKGEGDGKKYAKSSNCEMRMKVSDPPMTDDEAMSYVGEGTFEVARLKSFARLPSLGVAHLYIENEKPLLLEYMLPKTKTKAVTKCDNNEQITDDQEKGEETKPAATHEAICQRCVELNILTDENSQYQGFVRYVLEQQL